MGLRRRRSGRKQRPQTVACFVIPAFNEEENLPTPLRRPGADEPICSARARGSSSSTTARRTTRPSSSRPTPGPLPVELVRLEVNQGPGAAFRTGFTSALAVRRPGRADRHARGRHDRATSTRCRRCSTRSGAAPTSCSPTGGWWASARHRRLLSAGRRLGRAPHASGWRRARSRPSSASTGPRRSQRRLDRYGDRLIRERGFACKAELLAKLAGDRRAHRRGAGLARLDAARTARARCRSSRRCSPTGGCSSAHARARPNRSGCTRRRARRMRPTRRDRRRRHPRADRRAIGSRRPASPCRSTSARRTSAASSAPSTSTARAVDRFYHVVLPTRRSRRRPRRRARPRRPLALPADAGSASTATAGSSR